MFVNKILLFSVVILLLYISESSNNIKGLTCNPLNNNIILLNKKILTQIKPQINKIIKKFLINSLYNILGIKYLNFLTINYK